MPVLLSPTLALALGLAVQPGPARPIFRFETGDFWLNLHHFLYVLGRAERRAPDAGREAVVGAPAEAEQGIAGLEPAEQERWRAAVTFYAKGPSRRDAVFDSALVRIGGQLAAADSAGARSLSGSGVDSDLAAVLEDAAPLYRRAWWTGQQQANRARRAELEKLVDRHGAEILGFITRAYGMSWPADGYPVHLSGYANWAGAYSTDANLLVFSSRDSSLAGPAGLETVFHEAMHQWDPAIAEVLRTHAPAGREVPAALSHALLFFTAGEAVRRVVPDYVPYARAHGVWARGPMPQLLPALEAAWLPYLDGKLGLADALDSLFRSLPSP